VNNINDLNNYVTNERVNGLKFAMKRSAQLLLCPTHISILKIKIFISAAGNVRSYNVELLTNPEICKP